jgi:hypothetical protein
MSSAAPSAVLAGAKNPGQRARIKPQYQIPTWTAPPKRIIAAAVVERLPVITPDPEPWESAMWELQERKHTAMAKPLPDDWFRDDTGGLRKVEEEEGVEMEDATVGFAPRTTEADASNDTKSLERKLARRCVRLSLSLSVCLRVCLCMCLCRCRCRCVLVRMRMCVSWCACKGGKTLEAHQRALSLLPFLGPQVHSHTQPLRQAFPGGKAQGREASGRGRVDLSAGRPR